MREEITGKKQLLGEDVMPRITRIGVLVAVLLGGIGGLQDAHAQAKTRPDFRQFDRAAGHPRLVVMPPDVQLAVITAGGVAEPNAEWTEAATREIAEALNSEAKMRDMVAIPFRESRIAGDDLDTALQLVKLHGVVGSSIVLHQYTPMFTLPTKEAGFDWSLGPEVSVIGRTQEADYALFIFLRDSYASGGRVAAMVFAAALGVAIPGGSQVGFASVVDLRTGDVVWFNRFARASGDLRTADGARETVKSLLQGLPK